MYFNYDQGGNLSEKCQYGIFGEALSCTPSVDFTETHFADEKRDQESNLDYMGARYYSSTLGRFMRPDPSGLYYADLTNPQSLNLYSYALNNPLTNTDPTGLYCDYSDHNDPYSGFDQLQFDYNSNVKECQKNGGQFVNDAYTQDIAGRPQFDVSALSTPPAPGTDLGFDAQVGYDKLVLARQNPQSVSVGDRSLALAIGVTRSTNCAVNAFGRNALAMELDSVDLVPGAAKAKLIADVGNATVQAVNSAAQGDATGAGLLTGDLITKPVIAAVKNDGARAIPVAGEIYSGFLLARDIFNASGQVARCF